MKKAAIAAVLLAAGLGVGTPAAADPGAFEWLMKQAELNRDRAVTKQQFLDAMGRAYDQSMAKMNSDPKMVKGGMMTMDGVRALISDLYKGA